MAIEKQTLTRRELYDLVWSTPISTLSKKYNLADAWFRKFCKQMEIPLPKAGHWMKVKVGKNEPQPALSENYDGPIEVTLAPDETSKSEQASKEKEETKEILKDVEKEFKNTERTISQEPLIIAAKRSLLRKKESWHYKGILDIENGLLDIKVSEKNVNTALRFMDMLIKVARKRGHDIVVDSRETYLMVYGERRKIACRERCKYVKVKSDYGSEMKELHATGVLTLKVGTYDSREWVEGRKSLEEQIPDIIVSVETKVNELHAEQEKHRIHFAKLKEEEDRLKEIELNKERELAKLISLLSEASRWEKANNLRNYLETVERKANLNDTITPEFSEWLAWAKKKADWYDPTTDNIDELLENVDKESLTFKKPKATFWS